MTAHGPFNRKPFSKRSGTIVGRGRPRPPEEMLEIIRSHAAVTGINGSSPVTGIDRSLRVAQTFPRTVMPGPSGDYLRETRRLQHWLCPLGDRPPSSNDVRRAFDRLSELARTYPGRIFGPEDAAGATVVIEQIEKRGEPCMKLSGLPQAADGCLAVGVARTGESVSDVLWRSADACVQDGTAFWSDFTVASAPDLRVILDPAPTPRDFRRIALVASETLRQGPSSTFARTVRALTPYLLRYQPDLYVVGGALKTIFTAGLLRDYPHDRIHPLPPGRLGVLADLGAGVTARPVAGLRAALGESTATISQALDLEWSLDCVIYLLDPAVGTSIMPEAWALQQVCAHREIPFIDTYRAALHWFELLDAAEQEEDLSDDVVSADAAHVIRGSANYRALALLAHDDHKDALVRFAVRYKETLSAFDARFGTGGSAALVNTRMRELGDEGEWVTELDPGPDGGDLQIGEALAMGLCHAVIGFREPVGACEPVAATRVLDRTARVGNQRGRPGFEGLMLHDQRSAAIWALLTTEVYEPLPLTLREAFNELWGVDLVLAQSEAEASVPEQCEAIAQEAAWFLASALAANRTTSDRPSEPKRVTVACGSTVQRIIEKIADPVRTNLSTRIGALNEANRRALEKALAAIPTDELQVRRERLVKRMAQRKQLELTDALTDMALMWSVGPMVVAPMVGRFGRNAGNEVPSMHLQEAEDNAELLQSMFGGQKLDLKDDAFSSTASLPGAQRQPTYKVDLARHWAATDVAIMSCADFAPEFFGGAWRMPDDMYAALSRERPAGEVAGLYFTRDGKEIGASNFVRRGMSAEELRLVAESRAGRLAILVVWPGSRPAARRQTPRLGAALAALNAKVVSVLVTDVRFAEALLKEHLGEPATQERTWTA